MSRSQSTNVEGKVYSSSAMPVLLFRQLRPKQWTKNLLVFAALIFSFPNVNTEMLIRSVVAFFLFSFVSGCVYILNDFVDREADRQHPKKRYRPMASGALNPYVALVFGAILLVCSLALATYLEPRFGLVLFVYFVMNVAYSFRLKHVVIVDVMIIALGFVFRALGGGLVIEVPVTPWFFICTLLLALFLAISKRRHELILLENNMGSHRKVLDKYSKDLLNQLNSIVTTATIMSYGLFTFTSGRTQYLMATIPFVIYGIFRYLYLIHIEDKGGSPEEVLLKDKHILFTVILYALSVIIILKYFS
ncbi:decaprenyl-phosphate phosphoribosyltransferase [Aneurinibacillus aneurinilyticus]|uniref:Decaprenyl-phosphate phosphoribosyltransferase n=2 Tax=Aneurinibacillus aneurinilyticus TaxID=1391 RepID=A0A848CJI9_ANEAE|nr:decaprenyl-phosphate phosphoribosyltransferase [Aneurinibacillus aneurinilyticus]MED0671844.1 decaprenyl-phosphate phosphoribosyltransferase [Aneurinibacillus aneurinilyticus]MED0706436.1 decaprenyl-phosphate phosphoribosyltransferase [Aneurinibacillus aneurinilyticus]MED0723710.1 decaprenyl-phosphate phosphoribosyltransferase [Aneurinibacillus aneurinilyticus]MED0730609.1 decaprenyl-phosphate phosphoribosyltransferase [Aneurinibacillus aneurinilyticus]MED0741062.1 decaprenyl-phosphate phos